MKILHVIPSFNVGGGELLAVRLCAETVRQRPESEVSLVSLYDAIPSVVYEEATSSGTRIFTLAKRQGFDPRVWVRLYKLLNKLSPDVIHCHLAGLRYAILPAVFQRSARKYHTVHSLAEHEASSLVKKLQRFAFRRLGWKPVALSPAVRESIAAVYGVAAPVIPNGVPIDSSVSRADQTSCRNTAGLATGRRYITTIGRLWKEKNQRLLIDAYAALTERMADCSLLIVGEDPTDGSFRRGLEEYIGNLPLQIREHIHLLGIRKDVPLLLASSDVFVLPSDWEGVPLTLLEAMAYGTPAVCTAVGGMKDVIDHGKDGILFPKGDAAALVDALASLLSDRQYAQSLAENARNKFETSYSIKVCAEQYWQLYQGDSSRC